MRTVAIGLALALAIAGCGSAPAEYDEEAASDWVDRLAADELQGRRTGTPEGTRAAEAIAAAFEAAGLEPLAGLDGWFHRFEFPFFRFVAPARLALVAGDEPEALEWGRDFYWLNGSSATTGTAEVVFVGFGVVSPRYDDYAAVDVAGKIALAMTGLPPGVPLESTLASNVRKAAWAAERGAAGLALFGDPRGGSTFPETRIWVFRPERMHPDFFLARLDVPVADRILAGRAIELRERIVDTGTTASEELSVELAYEVTVEHRSTAEGANVIGVLEGQDPARADELVIVGAHYDGGGPDPDGTIYNGAEDNASGTAAMIELARTMATGPDPVARSVLFAAWGAEEQGVWGSRRFLEEPVVEHDRIAIVFTFDNVGVGDGRFRLFGARNFPEVFERVTAEMNPELLERFTPRGFGGSDGYPFQELGIPSLFAHADAPQPWVHTPEDDAATISAHMLGTVGRFGRAGVRTAANAPPGAFDDPDRLSRYLSRYSFVVGWLEADPETQVGWDELRASGIDLLVIEADSLASAVAWTDALPQSVESVRTSADLASTEEGAPLRTLLAFRAGAGDVDASEVPTAFVRVSRDRDGRLLLQSPDRATGRPIHLVRQGTPEAPGESAELWALDVSDGAAVRGLVDLWLDSGVPTDEVPGRLGAGLRAALQLAVVRPL